MLCIHVKWAGLAQCKDELQVSARNYATHVFVVETVVCMVRCNPNIPCHQNEQGINHTVFLILYEMSLGAQTTAYPSPSLPSNVLPTLLLLYSLLPQFPLPPPPFTPLCPLNSPLTAIQRPHTHKQSGHVHFRQDRSSRKSASVARHSSTATTRKMQEDKVCTCVMCGCLCALSMHVYMCGVCVCLTLCTFLTWQPNPSTAVLTFQTLHTEIQHTSIGGGTTVSAVVKRNEYTQL